MNAITKIKALPKNKKIALTATASVLALILISLIVFFTLGAISRAQTIKLGTEFKYGTITEYDWSESDVFDINDYPAITVNDKADVLFITDVHVNADGWYTTVNWTSLGNQKKIWAQIDTLIANTNPQLIVCTGDTQADPLNDVIMQKFADYLDSKKIPWAFTFGNHDAEWRADKAYLMNIMENSEYCITQAGPTNLQGLGNDVIILNDASGKMFYAIITLDTGDWQQLKEKKVNYDNVELDKSQRRFSTPKVGVSDEQALWYEWVVQGLTAANGGVTLETMVCCHIPIKAFYYAEKLGEYIINDEPYGNESCDYYETPEAYKNASTKEELTAAYNDYKANYKFYKMVKELGSTKHFATGHNHNDGYTVLYDNIWFTSVCKTSDNYTAYEWDNGKRGGTHLVIGTTPNDKGTRVIGNSVVLH